MGVKSGGQPGWSHRVRLGGNANPFKVLHEIFFDISVESSTTSHTGHSAGIFGSAYALYLIKASVDVLEQDHYQ